jgi:hypothetical protein
VPSVGGVNRADGPHGLHGEVRRRMTVYLSKDTADRLKAWCETERRETSACIDGAINEWLDRQVRARGKRF